MHTSRYDIGAPPFFSRSMAVVSHALAHGHALGDSIHLPSPDLASEANLLRAVAVAFAHHISERATRRKESFNGRTQAASPPPVVGPFIPKSTGEFPRFLSRSTASTARSCFIP